LVEFNATGVLWLELQMIPFSKISCLNKAWDAWDAPVMTYLVFHIVPIPETASMRWCMLCIAEGTSEEFNLFVNLLSVWETPSIFSVVVEKFCLVTNAVLHLAEFDTTCKHLWSFKYAYFFKISGLDFDFFLGAVVTSCGTTKHFLGEQNHELQEQ
jgi:hypothetical protein